MFKPVIFLGPTLSVEKAKEILDADYKPPAKKGDLLQLIPSNVKTIGIIDGYFLQDYPPTPIEVYNLLRKKDVKVYGSSSLGALRAVELNKFGMIGIGKIFELFLKGVLDSDDEVAVTFTGYSEYKSDALIDIRYNLFLAQKNNIIDKTTKKHILQITKKTYFPYRTYNDIIEESKKIFSSQKKQFEDFQEYLVKNKKSLKEKDAIKLLIKIKEELNKNQ
ncbi:MAG: TfuA-related McrA-glycine thioamidation protein [Nitrosopumilus sp.]|nr:TfuA-related McrA-glycine thioamidation protein [Nitrosopumilus sp.]